MLKVLHCSAECYPYAKVGGLADVAGSLPKYQSRVGIHAMLIMPMHRTSFLLEHQWEVVHQSFIYLGYTRLNYTIIKERENFCGFEMYAVDIHGVLDREKVYGYEDDSQRYLTFQMAVVSWLECLQHKPDVVHVHDHHTSLIPFFMQHTSAKVKLTGIKTVLTIHNAQYQGNMPWTLTDLFPSWDSWKTGLLEWHGEVNSLACGIKCADKVNSVSRNYMQELRHQSNGLELLFEYEKGKCSGIINGIDFEVWNSETDTFISENYGVKNVKAGKQKNKKILCEERGLNPDLPLFIFIGRLVYDKAADLLPEIIEGGFGKFGSSMNWMVLGSGDRGWEYALEEVAQKHHAQVRMITSYNEPLSHQMYAAADFLLMPSRVEPCGLNQLYAMRYGTIPMVRRTGGLQDTVIDMGENEGFGICFTHASQEDILQAIDRALYVYHDKKSIGIFRERMMKINHSWAQTVREYSDLYNSI
jgi:starch synthase